MIIIVPVAKIALFYLHGHFSDPTLLCTTMSACIWKSSDVSYHVPARWPEELSGVDTGGIFIECPHVQYLI